MLDSPGHVQIEHEHVRMVTSHVAASRLDILGLGDDLEAVLVVQQLAQPASDDRVVIGDHDSDRAGICILDRHHPPS